MAEEITETENKKEVTTYKIPKSNIPYLEWKLERLNKRAKKLGVEPVRYQVINNYCEIYEIDNPYGIEIDGVVQKIQKIVWFSDVQIVSEKPVRLDGWELSAVVTKMPTGESLVNTVPDHDVPSYYRNADPHYCDHCKSLRTRKDVFIMHNTLTGEYKQIGRQCIQDFLGGEPGRIFAIASWVDSISSLCNKAEDRDICRRERSPEGFGMEEYMAMACCLVRKTGFRSRNTESSMAPTASDTQWLLSFSYNAEDAKSKDEFIKKYGIEVEDQDREEATKVIEWARAIPVNTTNNYLYNLGVAARLEYVTYKTGGFIASAIQAYAKEVEHRERQRQITQSNLNSEWVGEVEKRIIIRNLKQVYRYVNESDYGVRTFLKFVQEGTGNVFIWWASGSQDLESETPINIKATIKAHETYKDVKQTVIFRVVVVED